jgi:predicted nucleotidyltransferase
MTVHLALPQKEIAAFCRRYHIRRLMLFGSALREDFGPESDIDLLAEFEPGHVPGFLGMAQLQIELSKLFGRDVDLRTPAELSRYFRDEVLTSSRVVYE